MNENNMRLYESGYRGYLSLELFIEDFEAKSALELAKFELDSIVKTYLIEA
ncbi:hypothetical protein ACFOLF_00135 [Paenibacillus sepulcri]|uniref:Uncharacterized protein n=1 Tax=Paenibacillus sepulcri TaxID=359917 RepID=A0ABS7BWW7_9BACL|nr:hypothetical protein [Paenibacillus sepulcri]